MKKAEKKKHSFPTAYTVVIIVLLLVQILTFFIPAGNYATIAYSSENRDFVVTNPNGTTKKEAATQATLAKYKVKIKLKKFTNGTIYKPVAIPDSYQKIKMKKPSLWQAIVQFLTSQVQGIAQSIDIIAFVLILGGCIGVVHANGAIDAGMEALSKKIQGKQILLIVLVMGLIAIGGTTFGLAEETMAFYPILIPVFLMAGFDRMTVVATIFLGTSIGTMASTINPFSTVIASNAAGVNFTDALPLRLAMWATCVIIGMIYIIIYAKKVQKNPKASYVYNDFAKEDEQYQQMSKTDQGSKRKFTLKQKLTLLTFAIAFIIMIWGVQSKGWYFTEISVVFLAAAYVMAFVSGLGEKKFVTAFVSGAGDLLGVALTIGLARAVAIVMENSHTSDTIMNFFADKVTGMPPLIFIWVMFFVYIILGFFIQSSSGLAVLSMPIMAPLANVVGIDRASIIDAYNWGQGFISLVAPTGLILMSLMMVNIGFDKWFKFCWKLLVIEFGVCLAFLAIGLVVY